MISWILFDGNDIYIKLFGDVKPYHARVVHSIADKYNSIVTDVYLIFSDI